MTIRVVRSARRTMALELHEDELIVRVPYGTSDASIRQFLLHKQAWIEQKSRLLKQRRIRAQQNLGSLERLSIQELQELADQAAVVIPQRVRIYAEKIGVSFGHITIRNQRTRWGSCSAKGNLNFNCLLMLTPLPVLDSVVVHELCHRLEMNHSQRFYQLARQAFPDYDRCSRWLKENGSAILSRMP